MAVNIFEKFRTLRACSVAASYKPPMLVTRAQLPACALYTVLHGMVRMVTSGYMSAECMCMLQTMDLLVMSAVIVNDFLRYIQAKCACV